ncbi:M48 family metalloprotease [Actinospica robiniae]|uniref:M48 family metalloprotease n=1 Tax=Actinospica robiniae TaxID=304901 RepID=UPI00041578FC|nr:M48 family metallopeptidase [Actinospica robiniae]
METLESVEYVCPKCATRTRLDPRFVLWCLSCGHGADPYPPEYNKREARTRDREIERSLALYTSLKTAKSLRPSSGLSRAVAVYSLLVHVIGVLVVAAPLAWLLGGGPTGPAWIATLLGAGVFIVVRPRLGNKRLKPEFGFDRGQAPRLYALLDRCSAELGCRAPDRVSIAADFNASTWRAGLAQRRVLRIGAPLWNVLTGPERLALLGHELGHQVNGDTTRTLLAGSAWRSLSEWTRLLHPDQIPNPRPGTRPVRSLRTGGPTALAMELAAPIVILVCTLPFFAIAVGLRAALTRLQLQCGQRAEYLADELGARLAGTEAALSAQCKTVFAGSLPIFVRGRRAGKDKADPAALWADFRAYVESMPENEFQRRLIVDRLRHTRTDRSHPADHLRIALLHERPALPGTISVSDEEWAAIDAELAPRMLGAARAALR